jgi:hypothetical protein
MTITFVLGSSFAEGSIEEIPLMIFLSEKSSVKKPFKNVKMKKKSDIVAHMFMAFNADGRSSNIVMA